MAFQPRVVTKPSPLGEHCLSCSVTLMMRNNSYGALETQLDAIFTMRYTYAHLLQPTNKHTPSLICFMVPQEEWSPPSMKSLTFQVHASPSLLPSPSGNPFFGKVSLHWKVPKPRHTPALKPSYWS